MNSALHEIEGRLAMHRIELEAKARQVLAHGPGARATLTLISAIVLVEGIGYFAGSRQLAYGALMFAGLVWGMLFSVNRRLDAVITLLRLQDERNRMRSDA